MEDGETQLLTKRVTGIDFEDGRARGNGNVFAVGGEDHFGLGLIDLLA